MLEKTKSKSTQKSKKTLKFLRNSRCGLCCNLSAHINNSLYRKYAQIDKLHYFYEVAKIFETKSPFFKATCLSQYYRNEVIEKAMLNIRKVYLNHSEIPRIFVLPFHDLLLKCNHRKRLLDYYRIAKNLEISVQNLEFCSFLDSMQQFSHSIISSFELMVGQITEYDFSIEQKLELLSSIYDGRINSQREMQCQLLKVPLHF